MRGEKRGKERRAAVNTAEYVATPSPHCKLGIFIVKTGSVTLCDTNMLHNSKGLNKNYMWDVIGAEHQVSQASIDLFLNQENTCEG